MPTVEKLLVFLASPGDVQEERRAVHEIVAELNRTVADAKGVVLQVVAWEHDTFPGYGTDAQAIVNQQIAAMADYALFIGIMWGRLGSPTPRAASGTVEEFERAVDALERHGRPAIWFYFRVANGPADAESGQAVEVRAFRMRVEARGLPRSYASPFAFRELVRQHLTMWLHERPDPSRTNAQQVSSLIAILKTRAEGIRADWDEVMAELRRLRQDEAVERLARLRERFLTLHARHLAAVEAGDPALSHELVGEVHDVLFAAREIVGSAVGTIGRSWFANLRRQYIDTPSPDVDPEYAAVQRDLARLHQATSGRISSMRYPGEA